MGQAFRAGRILCHKNTKNMEIFGEALNESNALQAGDLLLAEPMLFDPNFQRSVILVCEHDDAQGTFGLVVNHPAQVIVEEIDKHPYLKGNLYKGGPVQPNTLHYLHKFEHLEGCVHVRDGIFWGGDYEQLVVLHQQGLLGTHNCRFFIGYSGWGEGQLTEELNQNSWVISRMPLSLIFEVPPQHLWEEILKRMGGKYRMFTNFPVDPSLN
jgi:putative transcriptional regulator